MKKGMRTGMHGVMVQPCPKCGLFVKDVDDIRVSHAGLALASQQGITISNLHVDAALDSKALELRLF